MTLLSLTCSLQALEGSLRSNLSFFFQSDSVDMIHLYCKDYDPVGCLHDRGFSSIGNAAGMKTARIRGLENSISINAAFKARLDIAVSVFSLNSKSEVLKLNPKGTQGLAAQSIHESLLRASARLSCFSTEVLLIKLETIDVLQEFCKAGKTD